MSRPNKNQARKRPVIPNDTPMPDEHVSVIRLRTVLPPPSDVASRHGRTDIQALLWWWDNEEPSEIVDEHERPTRRP